MSLFEQTSDNSIEVVDQTLLEEHSRISELYSELVTGQRTIIESAGKPITHLPVSMGKDSMTVLLATVDAYSQSIEAGTIEKNRPLIVTTVDTLVDAIPMRMFVRYCKRRLEQYATSKNINLMFKIVAPRLNDEYFIRWNSGQKLIPNASRRGDCSILLKVDPSELYIRNLNAQFQKSPELKPYAKSKIITCVGSRIEEGNRRSGNMKKQGISHKSYDDMLQEMEAVKMGGCLRLLKFAPIKNWTKDEVFTYLAMVGKSPIERPVTGDIYPAFLDNMALLIQIYGNGSNEACEVSVGQQQSGSCNGKSARFGCYVCTMVGEVDKSSTALAEYPRWAALGAEDALRVRDYLYRLSVNVNARAFHARAYDPVGYNRIALQSNVLKARYLEKITYYATQLAVDSQRRADEFRLLVEQGREMEHEGYADIANDPLMTPKEKSTFLEMYKEQAQQPQYECFSAKHAALLSFRWDIDGIGSLPYRPLAIWRDVNQGKRLPYPKTNPEYIAINGAIAKQDVIPDAVMLPLYKHEDPQQFVSQGKELLDHWLRPNNKMDVWEADMNCSLEEQSHKMPVKLVVRYLPTDQRNGFEVNIESAKIEGRSITAKAFELLQASLEEYAQNHAQKVIDFIATRAQELPKNEAWAEAQIASTLEGPVTIKAFVPHLRKVQMLSGLKAKAAKAPTKIRASMRKLKRTRSGITRHNSSLKFYNVNTVSRLEQERTSANDLLVMNFDTEQVTQVPLRDNPIRYSEDLNNFENIDFDDAIYADWVRFGGLEEALKLHDDLIETRFKKRHQYGYKQIRGYVPSEVAETLLRSAGLSIASTYYAQLTAILRRTQLFSEIGALQFQNWSLEKIQAYEKAITMEQHRRDKIRVLLEIRRVRNLGRRRTKALLAKEPKAVSYTFANNVTVFSDQVQHALYNIEKGMADALGGLFFDNPVNLATRAKASQLWLALHWHEMTDSKAFASSLVGKQLSDVVFDQDHFIGAKKWKEMAKDATTKLAEMKQHWTRVAELMEQLVTSLSNEQITVKAFHKEWHSMVECHQRFKDEVHFFNNNWTPGVEYAVELATARLSQIKFALQSLETLEQEISKEAQAAIRKSTKSMSLTQRLAMMKSMAA